MSGELMIKTAQRSTKVNAVNVVVVAALSGLLGGCGSMSGFSGFSGGSSSPQVAQDPGSAPSMPASIRADELAGKWGLASYHKPEDRVRTENAARGQCKQPYVIGLGKSGGVVMHLPDEATPQELTLKGSPSGKNYIGPEGPAGGAQDREIVSFDGRILATKFIDPDAAGRYGTMVYVRCAPRA
jgi:hypothetical protein